MENLRTGIWDRWNIQSHRKSWKNLLRVLRGYKMQFVSRDGKYKCMDMDIKRTGKETGERYVNINTISHLIYNGVKYVVE